MPNNVELGCLGILAEFFIGFTEDWMSPVALFGVVVIVALTNVLVGMTPGKVTGNAQFAVWLASLLIGVITYVALKEV